MHRIYLAGGLFRLYIKFTEHYNTRPPDVCFHTIPFHPNGKQCGKTLTFNTNVNFTVIQILMEDESILPVDAITGKPALDMLINPDEWKDSYTLSHILVAIQVTCLSSTRAPLNFFFSCFSIFFFFEKPDDL